MYRVIDIENGKELFWSTYDSWCRRFICDKNLELVSISKNTFYVRAR